jgi:SHS2 domain-containing protein
MASFELLEDAPTADAGFIARGATLSECFQAAADATLSIMIENPDELREETQRQIRVEHNAIDLLLVRFLEELVYFKDAEGLFLRAQDVRVEEAGSGWRATALLTGEPIDTERHHLSGDIKAVTLHRLDVRKVKDEWRAVVVVDI